MKVELNPEYLLISMKMWRETLDFQIPIHDQFKLHFITNRRSMLENFVVLAKNWETVLKQCKAEGDDATSLEALQAEVVGFKDWAETGLKELAAL